MRVTHPLLFVVALLAAWSPVIIGQDAAFAPTLFQDLTWRNIGPLRGGRTRAAVGDPARPNVLYIGVTNGGVWRTTDYGRTWEPIFDEQPTGSIGDIAVATSNPDIIYVATGEGLQRPDLSVGNGVYKTTDGGKTWTHLGLRDGQQLARIIVDPRNPDRVFVAVLGHPYGPNPERGIYRSLNGGTSFEPVLQKDEDTGGNDVEFDPVESRCGLRDLVGSAPGALGERRMAGDGRRHLQVHRWRHDLDTPDERTPGGRHHPGRHRGGPQQQPSRLRDGGHATWRVRLPVRRRRRQLAARGQ